MADDRDSLQHFFGGVSAPDNSDFSLDAPAEPVSSSSSDGEIAIDLYQTDSQVVIVTPLAGVDPEAIEIGATDDSITISGNRQGEHTEHRESMITQEIYWGSFSRTVELPAPCDVDKATADFKHGVLTVKVPKIGKAKKKVIKVKTAGS